VEKQAHTRAASAELRKEEQIIGCRPLVERTEAARKEKQTAKRKKEGNKDRERERIHFGVAFSINNNFKVRRDTCCDSTKKGKDMNEKRKKRNRIMNE
jgi:hypothetical protein